MSSLGLLNRSRSPTSATTVAATMRDTPSQGLVGGDEGRLMPLGDQVPDLPGETQHPGAGLPHRVQVFLEDDLLGRVVHDLLQEPGPMAPAPGGFARINAAVTQQKGHGALPGPALHADGLLPRPR